MDTYPDQYCFSLTGFCAVFASHCPFGFLISSHPCPFPLFYPVESTVFITYFESYQKTFHSALPVGPHFHPYSPGLPCPWPLGTTELLPTSVAMQRLDAFAYERSVCQGVCDEICLYKTHHQLPSSPVTQLRRAQKISPRERWLKIFLLENIRSERTILPTLKRFASFHQVFSLEENPEFGQSLMTSLLYFQKLLCLVFRLNFFVLTFKKYDAFKP